MRSGERQRIKLAKNLGKKGKIIVMDEPATGLHLSDIENLLNLDVMRQADWNIDIVPDGGNKGGEVVFTGTPIEMRRGAGTLTADSLRASFSW